MKTLLVFLLLLSAPACSGTQANHVAIVAVLSAGGVVNELQALHHAAYSAAVSPLPHGPAFDAAVAPYDVEYAARGAEIQALATNLIAAAAIIDAVKTESPEMYRTAATLILDAIARTIASLQRGGLLPAIAIPASVNIVVSQLRVVVGAGGSR